MAEATHGVTIRDLYRHAAALLDEIEKSGHCIVISRYGRAVAFLGPLPEDYEPSTFERVHVAPRFQGMAALVPDDSEVEVSDEEIAELGEEERIMLAAVAASEAKWWMPPSREELKLSALMRLERRDLIISRAGGGWKATPRGIKAASRM